MLAWPPAWAGQKQQISRGQFRREQRGTEPCGMLGRLKLNRLRQAALIKATETAMTPIATAFAARAAVTAAIAFGGLFTTPTDANALSLRVKLACASDYYKHCSSYSPNSSEVRQCMRSVGAGLSRGCVDALVSAGEVSQAEVDRRRTASQTASR